MTQEEPPTTMVCLLCGEVCQCRTNDKNSLYEHLESQHEILKRRKDSGDTDDCAIRTIFCEKAELLALQKTDSSDSIDSLDSLADLNSPTEAPLNSSPIATAAAAVVAVAAATNTKAALESAKEIGVAAANQEILAPVNKINQTGIAAHSGLQCHGDEITNLDFNANIKETLNPFPTALGCQDFSQQYDCSASTSATSISLNLPAMRFCTTCNAPFTVRRRKSKRLKFLSCFNFWPFKYFIRHYYHHKSSCPTCKRFC